MQKPKVDIFTTAASFMFQAPFDHNLRNSEGMTPLMLACRLGRKDFVQFLLVSAVYYLRCETCRGIDDIQGDFNNYILYLLWLNYIDGFEYDLGLGLLYYAEIESRDPSDVNMFCMVQCSHLVLNPNLNPYPYPSPVM